MSGSEELIKIETWLSDSIELSVAVPSSWPLKQVITSIRNKVFFFLFHFTFLSQFFLSKN